MDPPFEEMLIRLRAPGRTACRYRYGPVSCFDEEDYDRLGLWYAKAVAALQNDFGLPLNPSPLVMEPLDIEYLACWRCPEGILYALLWWDDNTRVRYLDLGVAARGTVFKGCWNTGD